MIKYDKEKVMSRNLSKESIGKASTVNLEIAHVQKANSKSPRERK